MAQIRAWEPFYVIVGTSAGALTGLQFVVLTLITEAGVFRGSAATLAAFGSPNVVHFCAALLVSAILSAPWLGFRSPGIAVIACGLAGFAYSVVVLRRALGQRDYKPVLEDWIWHATLPMLAYAALFVAGLLLAGYHADALYIVGSSTLLLMFVGIHNAWDTVVYVMMQRGREQRAAAEAAARAADPRPAAESTNPERPGPTSPPDASLRPSGS
jgi:hypothetical protein